MNSDLVKCPKCGTPVVASRCTICGRPVACAHWVTCGPECAAKRKLELQRRRREDERRRRAKRKERLEATHELARQNAARLLERDPDEQTDPSRNRWPGALDLFSPRKRVG